MSEKILITGGTGLVGRHLTKLLKEKGHEVALLSRNPKGRSNTYRWDIANGEIDPEALRDTTVIVHLAGANVGEGNWSDARKKEILESRTLSAALLVKALETHEHRIHTFISASATGYYGNTGSTWVTEDSPAANDFLANVCVQWEQSVAPVTSMGIRLVKLRIGVVLTPEGGALSKLVTPVKLFAGAPLGEGTQYMPWIHLGDLCALFAFTIEHREVEGVFNAVAPHPVTNQAMTKAIGNALNRPVWPIGVPSFALKLALGEMATIVLAGNRVSSEKIQRLGFTFTYPTIEKALSHLLS